MTTAALINQLSNLTVTDPSTVVDDIRQHHRDDFVTIKDDAGRFIWAVTHSVSYQTASIVGRILAGIGITPALTTKMSLVTKVDEHAYHGAFEVLRTAGWGHLLVEERIDPFADHVDAHMKMLAYDCGCAAPPDGSTADVVLECLDNGEYCPRVPCVDSNCFVQVFDDDQFYWKWGIPIRSGVLLTASFSPEFR